jgi:hypothetical protein
MGRIYLAYQNPTDPLSPDGWNKREADYPVPAPPASLVKWDTLSQPYEIIYSTHSDKPTSNDSYINCTIYPSNNQLSTFC